MYHLIACNPEEPLPTTHLCALDSRVSCKLVSQLQETGIRGSPILSLLASSVLAWSGAIYRPKGLEEGFGTSKQKWRRPSGKGSPLESPDSKVMPIFSKGSSSSRSPLPASRLVSIWKHLPDPEEGRMAQSLSQYSSKHFPRPPGGKKVCLWH